MASRCERSTPPATSALLQHLQNHDAGRFGHHAPQRIVDRANRRVSRFGERDRLRQRVGVAGVQFLLDNVRIYNRALTASEVQSDMNTGL